MVRLGEVADVAFSPVDKKTVDGESATRLCNYTDVFYSRRISPEMDFMAATATQLEIDRWALKRGDVLFTKDSETPDEIGIPAYVAQDMPNVLCGYHLGLARPNNKLVEGAYLAEALASPRSASEFGRIANGVTRFGLTLPGTQALPILLPPLEEQRGIAAVLDSIDEAIEHEEAVLAATERLRDAMLHELLTRGIPGRHTEWQDVPGLGTIPASWDVKKLGDVAQFDRGLSWSRDQELSGPREGSTPVIRIGNVQRDGFKMDDILHIRGVSSRDFQKHQITARNLVMVGSNGNPDRVGNLFLANRQVIGHVVASFLIRVTPTEQAAIGYLARYLASRRPQRAITESTSGSTGLRNLSLEFVRSLRLPLPPLPEQEQIADVVDGIESSIKESRMQAEVLRSLKVSAAEALLTGKVRVRGK